MFLLLALGSTMPRAESFAPVTLDSGFDMQVLKLPANGERLLIWLPSKYGIREGNLPFARTVQDAGIDYWLVDLHESYLAPTGRYAYAEFQPRHVKELIDHAVRQGWRQIFLGGESRAGTLATQAARLWQLENPGDTALRGMLFYHPYLIDGETTIGESARFLPIARMTNLPVYIFQPQLNTKILHSQALLEQLQTGGAPVYLHVLDGVRGGFHLRAPDRLNPNEVAERARIGERIDQALGLLADLPPPTRAASRPREPGTTAAEQEDSDGALLPIRGNVRLPLAVRDESGRTVDLNDYDDTVLLVNFWASWCGPCVKEIASLIRLQEHFADRPFRILAVNIGEDSAQVRDFFDLRDITPNFPVLFDRDGEAARAWRVYAVPSTYLLDRRHRVRYGYRGAIKWDGSGIIETIGQLLE